MAASARAFDLAAMPLGPAAAWAPVLRASVATVLAMLFLSVVLRGRWADHRRAKRACLALLGAKPDPLRRSCVEVWADAWERIDPQLARALAGETVYLRGERFLLLRSATAAEAAFGVGTTAGGIDCGEARHVERFGGSAGSLVRGDGLPRGGRTGGGAGDGCDGEEAELRLTQAPDLASFRQTALARAQTLLSQDS